MSSPQRIRMFGVSDLATADLGLSGFAVLAIEVSLVEGHSLRWRHRIRSDDGSTSRNVVVVHGCTKIDRALVVHPNESLHGPIQIGDKLHRHGEAQDHVSPT